jgi:ribosome-associated protein
MIAITATIAIEEREIVESFIRASGPGGQNVNKLATAVQLRFDVRRSPRLPAPVRARLERLAGRRLTREGVLVITAQRHRTQERNRQDALQRLIDLIRQAAIPRFRAGRRSRPPRHANAGCKPSDAAPTSKACARPNSPRNSRERNPRACPFAS